MNLLNTISNYLPGRKDEEQQKIITLLNSIKKSRNILVELIQKTDSLTKKDIGLWRSAWQMAINMDNPNRARLYDIYTDCLIDLHLFGCISQRKSQTLKKKFLLVDKNSKEDQNAQAIFEKEWFYSFINIILDTPYWGHSLVQLGDITSDEDGIMYYTDAILVPRKHVIPEYGVVIKELGDEWKKGINYRDKAFINSVIEVGDTRNLGLLLKTSPQSLSKKNMMTYWDMFGEIFGMPVRIGKTISQDPKDIEKIESMLAKMGPANWGLFPEGTDIDIKETTRGDAFNVYDQRIERCNSEISKGIVGQTMTMDNGSSKSQGEVHLEMLKDACATDTTLIKYIVNGKLIPAMIASGFPLEGVKFAWDEPLQFTPEQQLDIEKTLLQYYDIDPEYFTEKYKITINGKRESLQSPQLKLQHNNVDDFFV